MKYRIRITIPAEIIKNKGDFKKSLLSISFSLQIIKVNLGYKY